MNGRPFIRDCDTALVMTLSSDNVLAHYRLLQPLGAGGMGVVWKAFDTALGRDVALKVLSDAAVSDPDRLAMLDAEARALAALNHPNIVTIYSIEQAEGLHFLTMELVEGRPLSELIPANGLPIERFLDIAIRLTDAIAAAHRRGITHRDLKPGNVMIGAEGLVKVVDFGLASIMAPLDDPEMERATVDLALAARARGLGTLSYASPERVRGQAEDQRSDIFSLGVLFYEMTTGRRPFEGGKAVAVLHTLLTETPAPPSRARADLPPPLGRLIMRCLEKDPARRVQTVREIASALEQMRAGVPAPPHAAVQAIAVLPFDDVSQGHDQAYLCEGLAEEILTALAQISGLRVASRAATFRLKNSATDVLEIASRLQVDALLDGSVRRAGDQLRVAVELVDAASGARLWSETYEREMRDVFGIQDDIARRVVDALKVRMSAAEDHALRRAYTPDVDAYGYYLRGRQFYFQYNRRSIEFAAEMFRHAVALDPTYARGYAGLSDCIAYLYLYVRRDPALVRRALEVAQQALALAPELGEANASTAVALSLAGRHEEAERAFECAVRLNPQLFEARYFYARDAFVQGQLEQAVQHYEAASRIRPEDYQSPLLMAQSCEVLGRVEEAEAARRRGIALAEQHLRLNPDDVRALYMGANGLVALGLTEQGLAWARRAQAMEPNDSMVLYNLGCIYSMAGQTDEALDCLERAVRAGLTQRGWLEHDTNLDAVRAEPRFQALLALTQ